MRHKYPLALIVALAASNIASAQESADTTATEFSDVLEQVVEFDELVVTGSRAQPRSVAESAVPIDVVTGEDFVKQGGSDLPDLLRNVVPSYNVNIQPISDAATFVRPANLRGLAPDHTLVLVNGKRRHRGSVIAWWPTGVSDAAQGPDISPIPAIALKRVEVLRDGASAQYGSDAIAGVMNFQLKNKYQGASFQIKPGIFQAGDGFTYSVAGNVGLGSDQAWANLSAEYGNADETDRSVQRADAARLIALGKDIADPAQPWGQPIVRNDVKLFANYGAFINDHIEWYGHGNFASKEVEGGFYFRNPNERYGVYSIDKGETLLIGSLSGGEVPVVPIVNDVPQPDSLKKVFDDPDLFTFQEMFPNGFTPRFGATTQDRALLAGIKGTKSLLAWDLSASYGRHETDFFINRTINASLGPNTPNSFDPGAYIQTDTNFNLDVIYPLSERLFFASGLEYRIERFEIVSGEPKSYEVGPLARYGFLPSSNGFPGFSDVAAGAWSRFNWAIYGDAEWNPQDNWLLGGALRFENFEGFGATTNYKLATNYGINENVKVRGSFSTGFRAPTPGQQNAYNETTGVGEDDEGNLILVNKATIPSTHPAAKLVGGDVLEPEKSINMSAGLVVAVPSYPVHVTLDYFNIVVEDRLTTSQDFKLDELDDAPIEQLRVAGITNLQEFRFFTNNFATRTQGIDVVLTAPFGSKGELSLAYNFTQTDVTEYDETLVNQKRITLLERGLPRHRANVTLTHAPTDNWRVLGRVSYYGSWDEWDWGHQVFGRALLLDLESSFSLGTGSTITLGVQNVLNTEPTNYENEIAGEDPATGLGRPFGEHSPYGFGGAFWYGKYTFDL